MTEEKANEWLKQVKGRKIRRTHWGEGEYRIPNGEWRDTSNIDPYYWIFWCIDEDGEKDCWYVYEGFEDSGQGVNFKWVFVETFDDYLEMYYNEIK